jgi:hypothetical protein
MLYGERERKYATYTQLPHSMTVIKSAKLKWKKNFSFDEKKNY